MKKYILVFVITLVGLSTNIMLIIKLNECKKYQDTYFQNLINCLKFVEPVNRGIEEILINRSISDNDLTNMQQHVTCILDEISCLQKNYNDTIEIFDTLVNLQNILYKIDGSEVDIYIIEALKRHDIQNKMFNFQNKTEEILSKYENNKEGGIDRFTTIYKYLE